MKWLIENKLRVLKFGGLGLGCVLAAMGAFVGARYAASGAEYEGSLLQLVPADAAYVVHIPSVPKARLAGETFLDELIRDDNLGQLEASALWRDGPGKSLDGTLADFRQHALKDGLERASRQADSAGVRLFDDVLGGELYLAADAGKDGGYVALSRVSRAVRFRWQFIGMAQGFFPDGPGSPKFEYDNGVLKITPRRKPDAAPDVPDPRPLQVTLLDDVLVVADSPRLFNAALALRSGGKSLADGKEYDRALKLRGSEDAAKHNVTLWINLQAARAALPLDDEGRSPVDSHTSLPASVVGVMPDILDPVNALLSRNLDTTIFDAALYGVDLSEPGNLRFDQYLVVAASRADDPAYRHLRKTWAMPSRPATQLALLPPDTMFQVSYRQPLEVVYNDVFNEKDRTSLVGDFIVAMRSPLVAAQLSSPVEEMMFATAPRSYAPYATAPVPPVELPLPAFSLGFRVPGAKAEVARVLLEEYLQAQRGRGSKPGEPPKEGAVVVVELALEGQRTWGMQDPRDDPNNQILIRLNNSIRAGLVGEWLLLTNSESLLARALRDNSGQDRGLSRAADSPFGQLQASPSATIYLNWDALADYVLTSGEFFKLLRSTKYNTGLIDGRDPGELRREIASELGLDPADVKSLADPRVANEYNRRKEVWLQKCQIEGDRYVSELQSNFQGLRFFKDLAMTTTFAADHLHVKGILRVG